jgi:hypothetical protein
MQLLPVFVLKWTARKFADTVAFMSFEIIFTDQSLEKKRKAMFLSTVIDFLDNHYSVFI